MDIIGYSAGARNKPSFDFARNLIQRHPTKDATQLNIEACDAFAIFWNLVRAHAPDEVLDDFYEFLNRSGIYRMHGTQRSASETGVYTMRLHGDTEITVKAELAPPAGVFACNYAR